MKQRTQNKIEAMMIRKETICLYLLTLTVIIFSSCQSATQKNDELKNSVKQIDLTDHWSNPQEVKLSSIADSILYIPLQTKNGFILSNDPSDLRVSVLKNYLIIYDEASNMLSLFTKDGKYLLNFGRKGKGPGEYLVAREFAWDEKNNRVYISDFYGKKIIVYDFSGNLITEFDPRNHHCGITVNPNHDVGLIYLSFGDITDTARLEWVSPEGVLKEKIPLYQDRLYAETATWGNTNMYWIEEKMRISEPPFDTIYELNTQGKFEPVTAIIAGPNAIPRELWFNSKRWRKEAWNYLIVSKVFENSEYVFIESQGKQFCHFLHNKNKEETIRVKSVKVGDKEYDSFFNDLDGGLPFWPRFINNDFLITIDDYQRINDFLSGDPKIREADSINPVMQRRFWSVAKNISEQDNPVVVIARIKK